MQRGLFWVKADWDHAAVVQVNLFAHAHIYLWVLVQTGQKWYLWVAKGTATLLEVNDGSSWVYPVAASYLEVGVLPIEYEIDIRRLRFLWTILQKSNDDPVRMVYTEMLKYPFEENWANDVMKLRRKYDLSMDDACVQTTGMNEWKYFIKSSVKNYAFRCLTKTCNENKKTQYLQFVS